MPRMPDWTDVRQNQINTGQVRRAPKEFVSEAVGRVGETFMREEKLNNAE